MDVPFIKDAAGVVVDIRHDQADYVGHTLVELAREIVLIDQVETRLVALEAACVQLIQNNDDDLDALLAKARRLRAGSLDVETLDVPLALPARLQPIVASTSPFNPQ